MWRLGFCVKSKINVQGRPVAFCPEGREGGRQANQDHIANLPLGSVWSEQHSGTLSMRWRWYLGLQDCKTPMRSEEGRNSAGLGCQREDTLTFRHVGAASVKRDGPLSLAVSAMAQGRGVQPPSGCFHQRIRSTEGGAANCSVQILTALS